MDPARSTPRSSPNKTAAERLKRHRRSPLTSFNKHSQKFFFQKLVGDSKLRIKSPAYTDRFLNETARKQNNPTDNLFKKI